MIHILLVLTRTLSVATSKYGPYLMTRQLLPQGATI
jgi:hypothetical protein